MERRMDRRDRERERSRANNNIAEQQQQQSVHRGSTPGGEYDSRTPLAWQHRDFNYQQQNSVFNERYPGELT